MKFMLALFLFAFLSLSIFSQAYAQSPPNSDKESFYRPVTHGDLFTYLPPRQDQQRTLSSRQGSFITGNNGCPDEINIGSVTEDTPIFGGVDVEIVIDGDIVVQCD